MSSWAKTDSATSSGMPKFAIVGGAVNKENVVATQYGWEHQIPQYTDCNGNIRNKREILVPLYSLTGGANTTNLSTATIAGIRFTSATGTKGSGYVTVNVLFNEAVTVAGTPTLSVRAANTTSTAVSTPQTLSYHAGSSTPNKLVFRVATPAGAANYYLQSGALANTGASIRDTGSMTAVSLTIPAAYTGANSAIGQLTTT